MAKHNRYLLTERQLSPVIRYINENYPAGINVFNFDSMSGADRPSYERIQDVTLKPNPSNQLSSSLIFSITTDTSESIQKEIGLDDDTVINTINAELPKYGYDIKRYPEWEVIDAGVKGKYIFFEIIGDGHNHQIVIYMGDVLKWFPELNSSDLDELSVGRGW
jgi:hypothetical protein